MFDVFTCFPLEILCPFYLPTLLRGYVINGYYTFGLDYEYAWKEHSTAMRPRV